MSHGGDGRAEWFVCFRLLLARQINRPAPPQPTGYCALFRSVIPGLIRNPETHWILASARMTESRQLWDG
jgi:hypothetical protein